MEVLSMFTDIPAYTAKCFPGITQEEYANLVAGLRKEVNRAIELFDGYWRTGNPALFDMSMEALTTAYSYSRVLLSHIYSKAVIDKLSHRATFAYELAGTMLGG